MHAGFPCFTREMNTVLRLGAREGEGDMPHLLDRVGGTLLAHGMAVLLKLGFGFIMRDSLLDEEQDRKARDFFRENFEIRDPGAPNGTRYYQGKFLIRTKKPGDDMNVYLRFCPRPEALFKRTPSGRTLQPSAVVSVEALTEEEAERVEGDPGQVDMVIRFKDLKAITGLVGRPDVDVIQLMLENVVQMSGNVGHLFKFGAIAKNIELALGVCAAEN